uniref:Integrase, catalytic region n=1 Tax=Medicago truncatula TaxID=3880 RepID=Q2HT49_MEDTR|nr:Integrase, catalytic region [Medicago truncatula]
MVRGNSAPSNSDSPYYIHPSDGPSSLIITPKLNGSNYLAWHRSMQRALGAKNKLVFLDGSISVPDIDDLNRQAWERCNHLIHSWIVNSVTESIAQTIVFHDTALSAWDDLKECFSKVDRVRVLSLRSTINNLKQGTKSVLDYFIELCTLWDELNSHRPIPNCTCIHPCRCESIRLAKYYRTEDQILQFLTGLNDTFSVVKTQILLMDPLPPINKVYSLVVQEESQNIVFSTPSISDDSSISVNASDARKFYPRGKGTSSTSANKGKDRFCTFCNRYNHTIEFCYLKYGHPNFNKGNSSANNAVSEASDTNNSIGTNDVVAPDSKFSLTQEKYDHLVALLQQANLLSSVSPPTGPISNHVHTSTISSVPDTQQTGISSVVSCAIDSASHHWILDSGANNHICSSSLCFTSFYKIKPTNVNLPNKTTVLVQYAGNVSFSSSLYLTNVLYCPTFNLNLISVSKMCKSLSCFVNFSTDSCIIQELSTKRMIGLGENIHGLYRLVVSADSFQSPSHRFNNNLFVSCNNVSQSHFIVIPNSALWHYRMGHLSHQRLSHMQSFLSISSAKFDLLHFDIWGPLACPSVHNHKYFLTIVDDFSRFVWIILLKNKSDVSMHVKNFINMIHTQYNITPKTVRSDNGPEFLLTDFYASKGIIHHRSCVETPQQNARVERKHQHILNVARALNFGVMLSVMLFSLLTEFLLLYLVTKHLINSSRKCCFLGYKSGFKGFVLFDLHSREIFISRNVIFHDHILPYPPSSEKNLEYFPFSSLQPSDSTSISTKTPSPPIESPSSSSPPQRISSRIKHSPPHFKDYICQSSSSSSSNNNTHVVSYPISHYLSYNKLSNDHLHFALSLTTHTEPKSYTEASKFDCWNKAMETELAALEQIGTWKLVDLPPNIKPIGCRWGLDYFDTYSPVAKLTTVRLIIALASIHHWFIHQLDVNNAFLHGELQENVYMQLPPGVKSSKPNQQANSDHSLFTKSSSSTFTILLVYVDDIILAGNSLSEFQNIKDILHQSFKIKDLGQLKYFLGLEVAHSKQGISLCQRKYCLDLLADSGLVNSKPVSTPSDRSIKLHNDSSPLYEDISSYRRLIGRLLYLNTTRPDITFITQQLSQFLTKPTQIHYTAAMRVLRYLKSYPGKGLLFPRDSTIQLLGFSDVLFLS